MKRSAVLVLVTYGLISAIGLHYHELFLDEAHHFLVSRDSSTLGDLYVNLRYDGHPRLWGALLFFLTHYVTADPVGMQVLQWFFAMAAAYVLLRYGPFTLWMKIGILAGYYFLFEYDLISRNYAIGIWMLLLCCHLVLDVNRNAWTAGILLLLMCSTHFLFVFSAIGILAYVVTGGRASRRSLLVLAGCFAVGIAAAIIQAQTPSAGNVNMTKLASNGWITGNNLAFAAGAVVQGWVPVPQVNGGHFWNTGWLNGNHLGSAAPWVLSVGLLGFAAVGLRGRRAAGVFYGLGVGLLILFFVTTRMTANRYFGMVYLFFLAAAWLTSDGKEPVLTRDWIRGGRGLKRIWWAGWVAILAVQIVVGLFAYGEDLVRPFSQSRNTARYLESLRPDGRTIVLDGYTAGPQLCAYLQCKLYCLATQSAGSFCIWRREFFPSPRPSIGEEFARNPSLQAMRSFILVSNRNLGTTDAGRFRLTPLKSFENSIVGEDYFIYRVDEGPLAGASAASNPAF